jgi:DNA repair photolyase
MSAPGRPKREYRSAQREGSPMSAPGRPKREYRSAQREGSPMSTPGRPGRATSAPIDTRDPAQAPVKGRGATFNPANRFRADAREPYDDGWEPDTDDAPPPRRTTVTIQRARTIVARNDSPDIPFTQSINPYQGCEHGCIYCYARPTHAYLDLSPGIDFETRLYAKPDAAALLRAELAKPGYRCDPIALGTNTDPYQPIEREWKVTRAVLEVLAAHEHPFTIVTKSALVERDIDLIAPMAAKQMARVYLSITTLDRELARKMEPRAAAPQRRLQAVRTLSDAGIPVGVMVAPIIPQLNDRDLEAILEAAAASGASGAGWVLIRLPLEVAPLFREWLDAHYPLRAAHIMSLIQQMRGGRDYDSTFGSRMRGQGEFAALLEKRFAIACRRLGLNRGREHIGLDTSRFRPPASAIRDDGRQGDLFA